MPMILSRKEILKEAKKGNIVFKGFHKNSSLEKQTKNQSIDVRFGRYLWINNEKLVDLVEEGGYELKKGEFYIAHTDEFIGTKDCNIHPSFKLKSSAARNGMMHTLAAHGDINFFGSWAAEFTYELDKPMKIEYGMLFAQVYFLTATSHENYVTQSGSYQNTNDLDELIKNWEPEDLLPKPLKI